MNGRQRDRWGRKGREAIFSLRPCSFVLFFVSTASLHRLAPLLPPCTFHSLQSKTLPRQMKIYRSRCPVGGFNLICHTVVARDCQGATQRNKEREERRRQGRGLGTVWVQWRELLLIRSAWMLSKADASWRVGQCTNVKWKCMKYRFWRELALFRNEFSPM